MEQTRKEIKSNRYALKSIIESINRKKKTLVEFSDEKKYSKHLQYFQNIFDQLGTQLSKMPKGHKYTGTFYVRHPYSYPAKSEKITGSAFMREDLVSWSIESNDEYAQNIGYVRNIFKDEAMIILISREEGEIIYD